jgi:hypothetical protein
MFILFLVALTSFFAYRVTKKKERRTFSTIGAAVRNLFEWVGTFSIFLIGNLIVGVLVVLIVRTFTTQFVTLYALGNVLLLILSAAQAFVFHHWWKRNG